MVLLRFHFGKTAVLVTIVIIVLMGFFQSFNHYSHHLNYNADQIVSVLSEDKAESNAHGVSFNEPKETEEKVITDQKTNTESKDGTVVSDILDKKANEKKLVFMQEEQAKYTRQLPDTRNPACLVKKYEEDLPSISVIIIFRNESGVNVAKTVHSLFMRTSEDLLDEIVLVDDNGDGDLDDIYTQNNAETKKILADLDSLDKVTLIINEKTQGLIRSRTIGADHVTNQGISKVLVFLDGHCEANADWLPPLLEPIAKDPNVVTIPLIDIISDVDYSYGGGATNLRGGFSSTLDYQWIPVKEPFKSTEDEIAPRDTPAMPGGLFAIHVDSWIKWGKYDQKMNIWGGENIEMSVRIWQCGGKIQFVPCSRVGHMFRINFQKFKNNFPYSFPGGTSKVVLTNKARCIDVWFYPYKKKFFQNLFHSDTIPPYIEIGDTSDRLELKRNLGCKDFDWYVDNIYPELKNS